MAPLANASASNHTLASSSASTTTSSSTAASASIDSDYDYDVFLNHRGADVKKTLVSHLQKRLQDHGFRVFLDKTEMRPGEDLTCQIKGAIATASVNIAIFSPRYAESKWCLKELVLMYNRRLEATILPVFYKVKPSDLKIRTSEGGRGVLGLILRFLGFMGNLGRILRLPGFKGNNGVYAKALRNREKKGRCDQREITNWKNVLNDVSEISGFDLDDKYKGDEGDLVEELLKRVQEKVTRPLYVAKHPVGLYEKLHDLEKAVLQQQQHSGRTKVVGIVGTGGVGKTTLVREFFNRNRSAYHQRDFWQVVRADTRSMSLQNQLHRSQDPIKISNIDDDKDDGRRNLSRHLSGDKALIVLDGVDHPRHMEALISTLKNVLSSDSLILYTSRNWALLSTEVSSIYKLTGLDREHSRKLFCLHAFPDFHEHQLPADFEEVVTKFLDACDGLPLSLEVFGQCPYGNNLKYWRAQLGKISQLVLPSEIESRLKISYDSLDSQEKQIFLDIACFFIKEDRDLAIRIWEGSGWEGSLNLHNLQNKCLLEIDSKNHITMHNHLKDLGRSLAGTEIISGDIHRRLWCPTHKISHNAHIQPLVRGIHMVEGYNPVEIGNIPFEMSQLHLLRAEGDCWERISNFPGRSHQLVWLCLKMYPHASLPPWIEIGNLRVLQVTYVSSGELQALWQNAREAPSNLEQFEKIVMEDVIEPLPEDFSDVSALKHLRIRTRMMPLPGSFGNSSNLEHIDFSGCTDLQMLPSSLSNLPLLKHLDLDGTAVRKLSFPEDFCPILQRLNISSCYELVEVGALPTTLISLDLHECSALEYITGLRGLVRLRLLDISGCNKIEELPGLETLTSLEELKGASECMKLKEDVKNLAQEIIDRNTNRST